MIYADFIIEARCLQGDASIWDRVKEALLKKNGVEAIEFSPTPKGKKIKIFVKFKHKKEGQSLLKGLMKFLKAEESLSLGSLEYDHSKLFD